MYQLILPGGDTAAVFNYEYRIPIFGPVTLAPFIDAGIDRLTLPSQLGLNADRVTQLNHTLSAVRFRPARLHRARNPDSRAFRPAWSCRY